MRLAAWALAAGVLAGVAALRRRRRVEPSRHARDGRAAGGTRGRRRARRSLVQRQRPTRRGVRRRDRREAGAPDLFAARTTLAKELLFAGRYADSVALVDDLLKEVRARPARGGPRRGRPADAAGDHADALGRGAELRPRPQPRFLPAADQGPGRAHAPRRLDARDRRARARAEARSQQPAGALAPQHRAHDPRLLSRRRRAAFPDPAVGVRGGASAAGVRERRRRGRARHLRRLGRRGARGPRRGRPARRDGHGHRLRRSDAGVPQRATAASPTRRPPPG